MHFHAGDEIALQRSFSHTPQFPAKMIYLLNWKQLRNKQTHTNKQKKGI